MEYMLSTCGYASKESELGLALDIHRIHRFLGLALVKVRQHVYFPQRCSCNNNETGNEWAASNRLNVRGLKMWTPRVLRVGKIKKKPIGDYITIFVLSVADQQLIWC